MRRALVVMFLLAGLFAISNPVGARIAVFATEEAGRLTSNLCSTTDPDTAIQELGPGTAPLQPADLEAPFDWPAVWLGVGALALVGGAWLAIRRLS
ncbi:MAG: hypothetical protein LC739_03525 [Actinobacteria bacterium]|nr:hypothetical protein [Actinomycetota bacterium]